MKMDAAPGLHFYFDSLLPRRKDQHDCKWPEPT